MYDIELSNDSSLKKNYNDPADLTSGRKKYNAADLLEPIFLYYLHLLSKTDLVSKRAMQYFNKDSKNQLISIHEIDEGPKNHTATYATDKLTGQNYKIFGIFIKTVLDTLDSIQSSQSLSIKIADNKTLPLYRTNNNGLKIQIDYTGDDADLKLHLDYLTIGYIAFCKVEKRKPNFNSDVLKKSFESLFVNQKNKDSLVLKYIAYVDKMLEFRQAQSLDMVKRLSLEIKSAIEISTDFYAILQPTIETEGRNAEQRKRKLRELEQYIETTPNNDEFSAASELLAHKEQQIEEINTDFTRTHERITYINEKLQIYIKPVPNTNILHTDISRSLSTISKKDDTDEQLLTQIREKFTSYKRTIQTGILAKSIVNALNTVLNADQEKLKILSGASTSPESTKYKIKYCLNELEKLGYDENLAVKQDFCRQYDDLLEAQCGNPKYFGITIHKLTKDGKILEKCVYLKEELYKQLDECYIWHAKNLADNIIYLFTGFLNADAKKLKILSRESTSPDSIKYQIKALLTELTILGYDQNVDIKRKFCRHYDDLLETLCGNFKYFGIPMHKLAKNEQIPDNHEDLQVELYRQLDEYYIWHAKNAASCIIFNIFLAIIYNKTNTNNLTEEQPFDIRISEQLGHVANNDETKRAFIDSFNNLAKKYNSNIAPTIELLTLDAPKQMANQVHQNILYLLRSRITIPSIRWYDLLRRPYEVLTSEARMKKVSIQVLNNSITILQSTLDGYDNPQKNPEDNPYPRPDIISNLICNLTDNMIPEFINEFNRRYADQPLKEKNIANKEQLQKALITHFKNFLKLQLNALTEIKKKPEEEDNAIKAYTDKLYELLQDIENELLHYGVEDLKQYFPETADDHAWTTATNIAHKLEMERVTPKAVPILEFWFMIESFAKEVIAYNISIKPFVNYYNKTFPEKNLELVDKRYGETWITLFTAIKDYIKKIITARIEAAEGNSSMAPALANSLSAITNTNPTTDRTTNPDPANPDGSKTGGLRPQ